MGDKENYDDVAVGFHQKLKDRDKRIKQSATAFKILLLGDTEQYETLEEIKRKLASHFLCARLLRDIADIPENTIDIPTFQIEDIALNEFQIVIMIDGESAGTVSESALVMKNKEYQEKSILFVDKTKKCFEDVMGVDAHYLYYPQIWLYEDKNDLINRAVLVAKKAAYRLATLHLQKLEDQSSAGG